MSTQTLPAIGIRKQLASDRRFYLGMAIASAILIFVGFSRTYYLKSHFPLSPALSVLVHVHGFVFTCWMLYFLLQTALIAVRRPALHRTLGISGAALAGLMVVMGLLVSFTGVRLHHGGAGQDAETIFLVGLVDLFSFAMFFVAGWVWRRDREAHQRLMLLAVVVGLTGPAIGRLGALGMPSPFLSLIGLGLLFAGPLYDLATRRRIHRMYVFGVLYALATFTPFRFVLGSTPWWHRTAHWIAGM